MAEENRSNHPTAPPPPDGQVAIYEDGARNLQVRLEDAAKILESSQTKARPEIEGKTKNRTA